MAHYSFHTLSNGLRIVYKPTASTVSYCGFAVNAGTRDELSGEFGMAHFVEHLIFKGTEHRKAWHILNRMENVGGELNAYTAKEETTVYAVFLEKHLSRAVELLCDLVLHSQFPSGEIDREVEVILDEINSYKDNPAELVYDEFENLLFSGHALGHNILGDPAELVQFTSQDGRRFLKRQYTPSNMVFFFMGHTPFKRVISLLENYMGSEPAGKGGNLRSAPGEYIPFTERRVLKTFQTHALVGNRAYSMFDERRVPLFLLNNILGGPGMNSRLNIALREKTGCVYTVESSVTSYTDTGVFAVYFGTDPKKVDKCLTLMNKEFKRLRDTALTASQLAAAKKQFIGQMGVGTENRESMALGLGKTFLHYNKYDSLEESFQRIEAITATDLLQVANEILDEKAVSTLVFV
ncbi:M16 family metallopeptidase [Coprobacter sp.]